MSVLQALTDAIRDSSVGVIDLTAPLSSETPIIQLPPPFGNTARFGLTEISHYDERGPAWYWNDIVTGEHTGTHFDAPVHWVTGKDGEDVSRVPVRRLIAPAVVLDFSAEAAEDPDFLLEIDDIKQWEAEHGPLPAGGWLLYRTGWDARSGDQAAFLNANETGPHTPGISVACASWLAEEAPIMGLGTETVGTDAGAAHSFDPSVSLPLGSARGGQVRSYAAAEPGSAARDRCRVIAVPAAHHQRVLGHRAGRWRWSSAPEPMAQADAGRGRGWAGAGRTRRRHRVRRGGERQLLPDERADRGRGAVHRGTARGRGYRNGGRLGQDLGPVGSGVGAPGARADQRNDRHRRGREEPDAAARARRRGPGAQSNFYVDVAGLAAAVGAVAERCARPRRRRPTRTAHTRQRWPADRRARLAAGRSGRAASSSRCRRSSRSGPPSRTYARPGRGGGRGARGSAARRGAPGVHRGPGRRGRAGKAWRRELARLADACGALLATSAVAKGLFHGNPWNLDVSGGFASPLAAELISGADVIVGWGCSLNMWTTRHGKLIGPRATIVQVDDVSDAIGAHREVHLGVIGDVAETARAVGRRAGPRR